MTTGKIEYSPDYKSDYDAAMLAGLIGEAIKIAQQENAEHARLEREVVDAAKAWRARFHFTGQFANAESIAAHNELKSSVDALESFEVNQKK